MKHLPYIQHTRPQSYPVTFFAAFTGYAISKEMPQSGWLIARDLLVLFVIFSLLLWGGTNAFNSGQDGDEGPLTLLPNPPPVPPRLSQFGMLLMFLAVALAAFVSLPLMLWAGAALLLSVWYSWKQPWFKRGKDIPFVDMLINTVGFGFSSIVFGYFITAETVHSEIVWIAIGFTLAYMGGMPTSQIFQLKAGDNNYVALVEPSRVLKFGALFFMAHIVVLTLADPLVHGYFWWIWIGLVLAAAIHSFSWSYSPFKNPYQRMNRQMILMMGSQLAWTIHAWRSF